MLSVYGKSRPTVSGPARAVALPLVLSPRYSRIFSTITAASARVRLFCGGKVYRKPSVSRIPDRRDPSAAHEGIRCASAKRSSSTTVAGSLGYHYRRLGSVMLRFRVKAAAVRHHDLQLKTEFQISAQNPGLTSRNELLPSCSERASRSPIHGQQGGKLAR